MKTKMGDCDFCERENVLLVTSHSYGEDPIGFCLECAKEFVVAQSRELPEERKLDTDKVYEAYEKWYKEKYPEGGVHYEDAILEFAAVLYEKLEAAQQGVQSDEAAEPPK